MSQPQVPTPLITAQLTDEEVAGLRAGGQNPLDFAVIVTQAQIQSIMMGAAPDGQKYLIVGLVLMIPHTQMPVKFGSMVDPRTGQPIPDAKLQRAFVAQPSPMARMVVARESLADDIQGSLRAGDAMRSLLGLSGNTSGNGDDHAEG